jgi:electron transfer flavoprotein alpha subunit
VANILVYIDMALGQPSRDSLHCLNHARRIGTDLGATTHAILICATPPSYGDDDIIAKLSRYGADKVVLITDPSLSGPALFETHAAAVQAACDHVPPGVVLFPAGSAGSELAPRIALRLDARFEADVTISPQLSQDKNDARSGVRVRKPVFCRQAQLDRVLRLEESPLVLAMRRQCAMPVVVGNDEAEVVVAAPARGPNRAGPIVEELTFPVVPTLSTARIVLAAGNGLGSAAAYLRLKRLGEILNAPVGATRAACQNGIAPVDDQIGGHGSTINAEIYLCFGASGSIEHLAALASHTQIAAVNTDSNAPIMRSATWALVEDANWVVERWIGRTDRAAEEPP